LHRLSGGIPRLINIIADRALLGSYAQGQATVSRRILETAATEALGKRRGVLRWLTKPWAVYAMAAAVALLVILGMLLIPRTLTDVSTEQPSAASSTVSTPAPRSLRRPVPTQPKSDSSQNAPSSPEPSILKPHPDERSMLSNLEWASDKTVAQSEALAYQTLFGLWDIPFRTEEGARFCQHAESSGLLCLAGRGALQDLLRLNHPAVLRLEDAQGQTYHATLTAIQDETATVSVGAQPRTVSLRELEQRWKGEFTLLWRAPPQYGGSLQVGDRAPVVDWLRLNMAKAEGRRETVSEDNKLFDQSFQETVKRFQAANGLKSDGIVGPQTIIRLNADVYSGDPHLTKVRKDG